MHELRTIFPYGLNDKTEDEFKPLINTLTLLINFHHRQKKHIRAHRGKNHKSLILLLPQQFLNDLYHILNTSIKNFPNFIRISISIMEKYYLKITHELLSTKLCDRLPDFIFFIYYHEAIDLIESKMCKPLAPKSKKKPPQNVYSIFFEKRCTIYKYSSHFT